MQFMSGVNSITIYDARLTNGYYGTVELLTYHGWRSLCRYYSWGSSQSRVLCRQYGFEYSSTSKDSLVPRPSQLSILHPEISFTIACRKFMHAILKAGRAWGQGKRVLNYMNSTQINVAKECTSDLWSCSVVWLAKVRDSPAVQLSCFMACL